MNDATTMMKYNLIIVTESMKTGLIAYRQVLKKAGYNYSKCCSPPMAEATRKQFSHIMQHTLPLKPSSSQVDKFPAILDSFSTEVGSHMVVSGELNNGREAGGQMAREGFMKKCQRKVNK